MIAATAHREQGQIEQAKRYLLENLHHNELTPKSWEWRESKFSIGQLVYREAVLIQTESQIEAVSSWRFIAARRGGRAIAWSALLPVRFRRS